MNNTVKKIIASITVLTCAVWMMGPGMASALTAEELQVKIDELLAEIEELQDQLTELEGEAVVTIEGVPADFTFETNLKQTDTGDDVKYLQIVLNSDSETQLAESGVGSAGEETSYFGPLTKAAVIKFQEKYTEDVLASWGLTEGTGYVGSTTRAKLNSLLAAAEEEEEEVPEGLTSVSPVADATDVAVDTEIEAVFDVALDEDTVNATSVGLFTDTTTTVEGTVSYDSDTKTITFTPSEDLAYETEYTVTLTTDITADDEAVLDEDYSWSFTTEEAAVVAAGLTVALASDTPVVAALPYCAALVDFLKVDFTAGSEGDVTVSGLTLSRTGIGEAADFNCVYLYDGTTRLTHCRSVSVSTDGVTFSGLNYEVEAGETAALTVKAELACEAAGADAGHSNAFQIASSGDITSDASEISGTFPITGNTMSIVSVAGGQIAIETRSISDTVLKVGETQQIVAAFKLDTTGSSEDVTFQSISIKNEGAADPEDMENFKVYAGSDLIAEIDSTDTDYLEIIAEETFTIEKGDTKTIRVRADIVGGVATGAIVYVLDEFTDLVAVGATYGFAVPVSGSYVGTTLNVEAGKLTVSVTGPAAYSVAPDADDVVFATIKFITGSDEDVDVNRMYAYLDGTEATDDVNLDDAIENVQLVNVSTGEIYDVVSDDDATNGDEDDFYFVVRNVTLPGGSSTWNLRADLIDSGTHQVALDDVFVFKMFGGADATGDADETLSATKGIQAENLDGKPIDDIVPGSDINGNNVTISGAALTVSGVTLAAGSAVANTSDLKLLQIALEAGTAEDVTVTTVGYTLSAGDNLDASNYSLYVVGVEDPVQEGVSAVVAGTVTFDGLTGGGYTIAAGDTEQFYVTADLASSGLSTTTGMQLDLTDNAMEAEDEDGDDLSNTGATGDQISGDTSVTGRAVALYTQGAIAFTVDASSPDTDRIILSSDTADVALIAKADASYEDVTLKTLSFQNFGKTWGAPAQVWYLDDSGTNADGLTQATAWTTIATAVAAASAGDVILAYPGTYDPATTETIDQEVAILGVDANGAFNWVPGTAGARYTSGTNAVLFHSQDGTSAYVIDADNVTIMGVTFDGANIDNSRVLEIGANGSTIDQPYIAYNSWINTDGIAILMDNNQTVTDIVVDHNSIVVLASTDTNWFKVGSNTASAGDGGDLQVSSEKANYITNNVIVGAGTSNWTTSLLWLDNNIKDVVYAYNHITNGGSITLMEPDNNATGEFDNIVIKYNTWTGDLSCSAVEIGWAAGNAPEVDDFTGSNVYENVRVHHNNFTQYTTSRTVVTNLAVNASTVQSTNVNAENNYWGPYTHTASTYVDATPVLSVATPITNSNSSIVEVNLYQDGDLVATDVTVSAGGKVEFKNLNTLDTPVIVEADTDSLFSIKVDYAGIGDGAADTAKTDDLIRWVLSDVEALGYSSNLDLTTYAGYDTDEITVTDVTGKLTYVYGSRVLAELAASQPSVLSTGTKEALKFKLTPSSNDTKDAQLAGLTVNTDITNAGGSVTITITSIELWTGSTKLADSGTVSLTGSDSTPLVPVSGQMPDNISATGETYLIKLVVTNVEPDDVIVTSLTVNRGPNGDDVVWKDYAAGSPVEWVDAAVGVTTIENTIDNK